MWRRGKIPGYPAQHEIGVYDKVAEQISLLTAAPLVPVPVFMVINCVMSGPSFFVWTATSILFAGVFPVLLTIFWSKTIKKIPAGIPDKDDRPFLLAAVILSYLAGAICLYGTHAPWLVCGLTFCYCTNTLIVLVISVFWKISIHSMGIAGPVTALVFAVGLPALLPAALLPLVMWSRVYLRRHTVAQVLAGAGPGIILTGIQLFLMKPPLA